jgi:hypothetical protein
MGVGLNFTCFWKQCYNSIINKEVKVRQSNYRAGQEAEAPIF